MGLIVTKANLINYFTSKSISTFIRFKLFDGLRWQLRKEDLYNAVDYVYIQYLDDSIVCSNLFKNVV